MKEEVEHDDEGHFAHTHEEKVEEDVDHSQGIGGNIYRGPSKHDHKGHPLEVVAEHHCKLEPLFFQLK